MSSNKYLPHVYVLPEDDANRELAIGFLLHVGSPKRMQVLRAAGGWKKVLSAFTSDHAGKMENLLNRFMVLLIDFDANIDRLVDARKEIPPSLTDRVFILGTKTNPEALRAALGENFESLGGALAEDCRNETSITWSHDLLEHNADEVERLRTHVRPFLFPGPSSASS